MQRFKPNSEFVGIKFAIRTISSGIRQSKTISTLNSLNSFVSLAIHKAKYLLLDGIGNHAEPNTKKKFILWEKNLSISYPISYQNKGDENWKDSRKSK